MRVLSKAETEQVLEQVPPDRILNARFALKDKARAQRLKNPEIPVKAKARLCVGGHRDPDLGVRPLAIDSPTATKASLMLGTQCAMSEGWCGSIGDIQAAFLNGVEAPRGLYFRQPARGLPGVEEGVLIEIVKGVFGLSTSPRLWFEKLVAEVLALKVPVPGQGEIRFEQNLIDPCVFHLVMVEAPGRSAETKQDTCGLLEAHVDDLLLWTLAKFRDLVQAALGELFPISEWENGSFKYVGNNYEETELGHTISQAEYVADRLKSVDIPKGMGNEETAPREVFHDNRTAVGCLSWAAKETRPDLAFAANVAQARQNAPCIGDIKMTNAAVKQAREYQDYGVMVARIPIEDMSIVVYHDAAWGNVDLEDENLDDVAGHKVGSQLGYLILAVSRNAIGGRPKAASLLAWRSHTCRRVCRSTFAGETMACCEGMECAIQLRAQLLSLKLRRLVPEGEAAKMIPIHAVTDCRSLFDFVHRCGAPKATADKRLVIDLASLRQIFLNEAKGWWHRERGGDLPAVDDPLKIPLHWVPSECQLGDVLTKQLKPEAWWRAILAPFFLAVHAHNRL